MRDLGRMWWGMGGRRGDREDVVGMGGKRGDREEGGARSEEGVREEGRGRIGRSVEGKREEGMGGAWDNKGG